MQQLHRVAYRQRPEVEVITAKLTQEQFDGLAEKFRAAEGISLDGKGGVIKKAGAEANWSFDGSVLSIEVTHAPFGMKSVAESKIKDALVANGVSLST
jgi:hypothetical protein